MPKKILIIDDEIDVMLTVVYRLKARGYEIVTAEDGKSGVETCRTQKPDLVILDYHLPDMSAKEVAALLREDPTLSAIPVVLMTASVQSLGEKAGECRAVDSLPKPFDSEALYAVIDKHIGKA
ncbi:MAG: response regulator [Syntrophales bacterium]